MDRRRRMINARKSQSALPKAKKALLCIRRVHKFFSGLKGPLIHLCGLKAAHILLIII